MASDASFIASKTSILFQHSDSVKGARSAGRRRIIGAGDTSIAANNGLNQQGLVIFSSPRQQVYRRIADDFWVKLDAKDFKGQAIKSAAAANNMLQTHSELLEAFQAFRQAKNGTGVALASLQCSERTIIAIHSPTTITNYPIYCFSSTGKEIVWRAHLAKSVPSSSAGDTILHRICLRKSSDHYVVLGVDSIRSYIIGINQDTGDNVALFDSRENKSTNDTALTARSIY